MTSSRDEQRGGRRVDYSLRVAMRGPKGITHGRCQSLGAKALFLETTDAYPDGTRHLPERPDWIRLEGRVVWLRRTPPWGLGIRFTNLHEVEDVLEAYTKKMGQTKPLTIQMWKFK